MPPLPLPRRFPSPFALILSKGLFLLDGLYKRMRLRGKFFGVFSSSIIRPLSTSNQMSYYDGSFELEIDVATIAPKRVRSNHPPGQIPYGRKVPTIKPAGPARAKVLQSGKTLLSIISRQNGVFMIATDTSGKRIWEKSMKGGSNSYRFVYDLEPVDRSDLVEIGVPAVMVTSISDDMGVSKDKLVKFTGLSLATVNRKIANRTDLSLSESDRVMGVAKLIGQVDSIVNGSGRPEGGSAPPEGFKAAKWFGEWIVQPARALGGRKPEDLLATADGREAVSKLLSQMQSGAYA